MQLLALSLDHRHADVRLRERLVVPSEKLPERLALLRTEMQECVLLSTCNRTELYALVGHQGSGGKAAIRALARAADVPSEQFEDALMLHWQRDAVCHLFRVTAGLESLIIGEHQILGQVRAAAAAACAAGTAGPILERLFRDAVRVGNRARAESGIARSAVSVSTAAVELAARALGSLRGRTVLLIGAGKMTALAAQSLRDKGAGRILVTNRSQARAEELAATVAGQAVAFERLADALAMADVAISSTAAPTPVVTEELARRATEGRAERRLVIVDIAVPRDVDPAVAEVPGCVVYNIDDLTAVRETNLAARRLEVGKVEAVIERETERFVAWWRGREAAPTIAELVAQAERIRRTEVERAAARLGPLSDRERNEIDSMTGAIVNKMLHSVIVRLKERGGTHDTQVYVHAARELFGLPKAD